MPSFAVFQTLSNSRECSILVHFDHTILSTFSHLPALLFLLFCLLLCNFLWISFYWSMVRWPSWHRFTFLTPPKKSDSAGKKKNTNHKNLHMVSCFKDGDPEKQRKANMMRKLLTPNPQNPWNIMCRASSLLKPEYFFLIFGRFFASAFAATFSSAWQSHTVTHHCTRKMRWLKVPGNQRMIGHLWAYRYSKMPKYQTI